MRHVIFKTIFDNHVIHATSHVFSNVFQPPQTHFHRFCALQLTNVPARELEQTEEKTDAAVVEHDTFEVTLKKETPDQKV